MISPEWHAVLSGERSGATAAACRCLLRGAATIYGVGVGLRNLAYDRGWLAVHQAGVPVVSVGNLTTGGTGKTPVTAWVAEQLRERGAHPGILCRGYGSRDGGPNDEQRVLQVLTPQTPQVQNRDRVAGASTAITEAGCDVLVLDDGFQHRRLARDLDIVLIDVLTPWGYGALLPRGLLRELPAGLRRADLVILTRADQSPPEQRDHLRDQIGRWTSAPVAELAFVPEQFLNADGETAPLACLKNLRVGAVCGIGNPLAFRRTLASMGVVLADQHWRVFPDHHHYGESDLEELAEWAAACRLEAVVVTQKDLVKLPQTRIGPAALWGLQIGVRFLRGEENLQRKLSEVLIRGRRSLSGDERAR